MGEVGEALARIPWADGKRIPEPIIDLSHELSRRYGVDYNNGCFYPFDDRELGGYHGPHWDRAERWRLSAQGIAAFCESVHHAPGRTLDLGCGRGVLTTWLRSLGVAAWGLDIGDDVRGATGAVGNVLFAPFRARAFKTIVALDIIEHLPLDAQPRLWWEIRRLGPSLILATVPTEEPRFARFSSAGVYNHYVCLPPDAWREQIFKPGGYTVLAEGDGLAAYGPPFSHGERNYPFALVPRPAGEGTVHSVRGAPKHSRRRAARPRRKRPS